MRPKTVDWQDRIPIDPNIRHGEACLRGIRLPVAVILANPKDGV